MWDFRERKQLKTLREECDHSLKMKDTVDHVQHPFHRRTMSALTSWSNNAQVSIIRHLLQKCICRSVDRWSVCSISPSPYLKNKTLKQINIVCKTFFNHKSLNLLYYCKRKYFQISHCMYLYCLLESQLCHVNQCIRILRQQGCYPLLYAVRKPIKHILKG